MGHRFPKLELYIRKMTMRKMKRTYATTTGDLTTIWCFTASNFQKTMHELIQKNFCTVLLETMVGSQISYKIEMFSTASAAFRREFLRNTKTLLAHGPTTQRQLSEMNHVHARSTIDCIWEKSQTVGKNFNDGLVRKQSEFLDKFDKLQRSSSQL